MYNILTPCEFLEDERLGWCQESQGHVSRPHIPQCGIDPTLVMEDTHHLKTCLPNQPASHQSVVSTLASLTTSKSTKLLWKLVIFDPVG